MQIQLPGIFFRNLANLPVDQTSVSAYLRGIWPAEMVWAAFPKLFAAKRLRWYSFACDRIRLVADPTVDFLFVFSLNARTSAGRIEMRSLINAINSVVVNGRQDRTNVAGIGSLRGLDFLLSSCLYSGHAFHAAYLSSLKSIEPAHQRTPMAEQRMFAMTETPCWHPARPHVGSPAFACTT